MQLTSLLLVFILAILASYAYAGFGGSFSDSLDEDMDSGVHEECKEFKYDAFLAQTDDGYKAIFLMKNPDVEVGYVDIQWVLNKPETEQSQNFVYRMNREGKNKFENILPLNHVDSSLRFGEDDLIQYTFRYWAVPDSCNDHGLMCNTQTKWFSGGGAGVNGVRNLPNRMNPAHVDRVNTRGGNFREEL